VKGGDMVIVPQGTKHNCGLGSDSTQLVSSRLDSPPHLTPRPLLPFSTSVWLVCTFLPLLSYSHSVWDRVHHFSAVHSRTSLLSGTAPPRTRTR
jgi:hypothetical protein